MLRCPERLCSSGGVAGCKARLSPQPAARGRLQLCRRPRLRGQAPPQGRLAPPPAPPPAGPHSGLRAGAGGPSRSARSSGRGSLGRCPCGAGPARAAAMVRRAGAGQGRGAQGPLLPAAPWGPAAQQPRLCRAGGAVSGCWWWTALRRRFQVSRSDPSNGGAAPEGWGAVRVLGPGSGSVLTGGGGARRQRRVC